MGVDALLRAEGLGRRFGRRWIFREVNVEIGPGQVLAVTGKNGQGKSTLLNTLCGMIPASEGTIQRTESWGISTIDMALYPSLTAAEHILFGARLRGVKSEPKSLLTRVGLADAKDVLASNMSTGMRARLKMALAIQHEPKLLFLDEPTAALDVSGREIVESITAEISEYGAVVLATNDTQDMRMATHELRLA